MAKETSENNGYVLGFGPYGLSPSACLPPPLRRTRPIGKGAASKSSSPRFDRRARQPALSVGVIQAATNVLPAWLEAAPRGMMS